MLRKFIFFVVLALLLVFLAGEYSKSAIASKEKQKLKEIAETEVSNLLEKRITQFSTTFEKVLFEREKESFDNSDTYFSEREYTKKAAPTSPANAAFQISAVDLWYPGGINSQWVYNQPFGEKVTATYTKNVEFEGRTYKLVEEDNPSFWLFDPNELGPDPFLTFRRGETNQILGCGVAANEFFEKFIIEGLIAMGIPKEILQVQSTFDEWVLLENPALGHNWTVMNTEVEATLLPGAKVSASYKTQAYIPRKENVKTESGEFNAFVVNFTTDYTIVEEVGGEIIDKRTKEEPLFTVWLAPNVGVIQLEIDDEIQGTLVEYHIEGVSQRFLTLPFTDADIRLQQGWIYSWGEVHKGIDYIKGTIDNPPWESFAVVAAAEGVAMQSSGGGYGNFVLIRHNEKDSKGNHYFTLYSHLDTIASKIVYKANRSDTTYSTWTPVARGGYLGKAGATGVENHPDWIHLHFEVQRGGYAQNKTDPYDLYKVRDYYPGWPEYTVCGKNYLWTTVPPATVAYLIQQHEKSQILVTVDGNEYFIVTLDGYIDPETLEYSSTSEEVKVYIDKEGNLVSDFETVRKINVIDFALQESEKLDLAENIKKLEELQEKYSDFNYKEMGLAGYNLLTSGYVNFEEIVHEIQIIKTTGEALTAFDKIKDLARVAVPSVAVKSITFAMEKLIWNPSSHMKNELKNQMTSAIKNYKSAQEVINKGDIRSYKDANTFLGSYQYGKVYEEQSLLLFEKIFKNIGMLLLKYEPISGILTGGLSAFPKLVLEGRYAVDWEYALDIEFIRVTGENFYTRYYWFELPKTAIYTFKLSRRSDSLADFTEYQEKSSEYLSFMDEVNKRQEDLIDYFTISGKLEILGEEFSSWKNKLLSWTDKIKNQLSSFFDKLKDFIGAIFKSPGELRVYDSQGRVTGLVNGEIKEEIPESTYDKEYKFVIILDATDSYDYEISGTNEGEYGLEVNSVKDGESTTFTATDIPTSANAVHQYSVDWDALSEGKEEAVTVQIDSEGDGTFEETVNTGETYTLVEEKTSWDVNSDGEVNIFDLVIVGSHFGESGDDIEGDVNNDGEVNIFDLVLVGSHFGEEVAAPSIQNISLLQQIYDTLKTVPNPNQNLKLALVELEKLLVPSETKLLQSYPNPGNPDTWIPYQLKEKADVTISIYDISGKLIRRLDLDQKKAGRYITKDRAAYWDGRNQSGERVSSGLYFYQLQAGEYRATKRMLILK